jgi:hypothetical protein
MFILISNQVGKWSAIVASQRPNVISVCYEQRLQFGTCAKCPLTESERYTDARSFIIAM